MQQPLSYPVAICPTCAQAQQSCTVANIGDLAECIQQILDQHSPHCGESDSVLGARAWHRARYCFLLLGDTDNKHVSRQQMVVSPTLRPQTGRFGGRTGGGGNFRWVGRKGLPQGICKAKSESHKETGTY